MQRIRSCWMPLLALAWLVWPATGVAWAQPGGQFGDFGAKSEPVVSVEAQFTRPDQEGRSRLFLVATIKPGWHIYSITQPTQEIGPRPTKISLATSREYRLSGTFQASPRPKQERQKELNDLLVESHAEKVVWHAPLAIASGVDVAKLKISGSIRAQPCTDNSCLPTQQFPFVATLGPGLRLPGPPAGPAAPSSSPAAPSSGSAAPSSGSAATVPSQSPETASSSTSAVSPGPFEIADVQELKDTSTLAAMLLGFAGGLILNLMPCVLPVIGLKLFAFIEQAGQSRQQALMLNVWYSLGLLAVFLALATLSVLLGLGWGQVFSYKGFTITMAAVVFAMGLSFLGVWEIPIPGFIGAGKANEWSQQEGASGAFAKGVLTTLLATPCSGPFLASALAWTANQPPARTYAVFTAMGLGMASPYLLIGAYPQLIRFLPKPGAWMETFKHLMGFVLLGTVVFVLTFIEAKYVVPTVALLFGIWLACWWIGRTPLTADFQVRLRAWLSGAVIAGIVWIVAFGGLLTRESEMPWKPFTPVGFQEAVESRKTVMVDFTADWCLTCKTLEAVVLNTPRVIRAVESHGVVPMKADWTHGDKDVTQMLERLGTKQVPVLAIFPAGNPNRPIRLLGGYRIQTVLDALAQASAGAPPSALGVVQYK